MRSTKNSPPVELGQEKSPETYRIAIVGGCGHVGLPLGMAFASAGCRVDLIDVAADRIAMVNQGQMPFQEEGAQDLLTSLLPTQRLRATADAAVLTEADVVVVTIGTPVNKHHDPGIDEFDLAIDSIIAKMRAGQLLVLRSTITPGLTDRLFQRLEHSPHRGILLAYCPERIVQGKSLTELDQMPQIIGAPTHAAFHRAAAFFSQISPRVIFLKPIEAELAKLFCNAYRYINFAAANQFLTLAMQHGADFYRVADAICEDYPRMKSFVRPGFAAGPCLVKDTRQLGAFRPGTFPLGMAAIEINEQLPCRLVQDLALRYPLAGMTVGILGMAFKPECDDARDSLSYKLKRVLQMSCRQVICTDPYVNDPQLLPLEKVLDEADLLVVGTPHTCYGDLVFRQPVIDISGFISKGNADTAVPGHSTHDDHYDSGVEKIKQQQEPVGSLTNSDAAVWLDV